MTGKHGNSIRPTSLNEVTKTHCTKSNQKSSCNFGEHARHVGRKQKRHDCLIKLSSHALAVCKNKTSKARKKSTTSMKNKFHFRNYDTIYEPHEMSIYKFRQNKIKLNADECLTLPTFFS